VFWRSGDDVNGSWRTVLRHRVAQRCGDPGERFAGYGHRFGDWIDSRPGPGQTAFLEVEAGVAGYLRAAAQTGRRWGTIAGLLLGAAAATVTFLVVWLFS
jgi:hypothetical protein